MIVLDENGLIRKVNPAVEKMFHYEEIELVGESLAYCLRKIKNQMIT